MKKLVRPFRLFSLFLKQVFFLLLELIGRRCSKCGSRESSKSIIKETDWGSNGSGNIAMEPFFVLYERRICKKCSHTLTSDFAGTQEFGNV